MGYILVQAVKFAPGSHNTHEVNEFLFEIYFLVTSSEFFCFTQAEMEKRCH